ncbi:MAG: serine protease [Bacteroidales bacterium]|jgi:serine protease Do|nr:serine protease [Bacteroidales bacterium]
MQKKALIISICLTLFSSNIFSQTDLKDLVCVVKPTFSEEAKTVFSDYAAQLFREGYMNSGRYMRALTGTTFGSGFIVKHGDKFYVLTNNHVVGHADSVILEFQTDTETKTYRHCRVLVRNSDLDLALIELPVEKKVTFTFTLLNPTPRDGTEVWSAGFPGIGNLPLWQLGKGVISNRNITNNDLFNPKISHIIQHTAQIDGGNSGGPLLVQNPGSRVDYDAIGINTWKANRREGTNFAVPAIDIIRFLDSLNLSKVATLDEAETAERMNAFASIVKSKTTSYKDILPFVSVNYMLSVPAENFTAMLKSASDNARIAAVEHLRNVEPFEAFRIVIADAIWQKRTGPLNFENIVATDLTAPIKVNFSENGKPVQSEWKFKNGELFMVNFGGLPIKQRKSGRTIDYDPDMGIYVAMTPPAHKLESSVFELGFMSFWSKYFGRGFALSFNNVTIPPKPCDLPDKEDEKGFNLGMSFLTFAQFPIQINTYYLIPYAVVPVGIGIGSGFVPFIGVNAGARFALPLRNSRNLYLGVEYRMRFQKELLEDYPKFPERTNTIGFTFGFEF